MDENKLYDVIVIGGGPVGIFTSFYAGMRNMSVKIIDSLPELGGQLNALYPEKYIYDVAGFSKTTAQELVEDLKEQALQFNPSISLNETVEEIVKIKDKIKVITNDGNVFNSRTIVITAGCGSFQPRKLGIPDCETYENNNVNYYIDDISKYVNKDVAVLGGGDSAVDWALMLEKVGRSVSLIHRRPSFRAHEYSMEKVMNSTINVLAPYKINKVKGNGEKATQLVIESEDNKQFDLDIDFIVVNYGFVSSLGKINNWGLKIDKNSIVVNSKMETNIEGVYAAGDIVTYNGKIKLIVNGFGDATTAISHAKAYIDGSRVLAPHSTHVFNKSTSLI